MPSPWNRKLQGPLSEDQRHFEGPKNLRFYSKRSWGKQTTWETKIIKSKIQKFFNNECINGSLWKTSFLTTTLAQAPSPTTPSTEALHGATSQQQAATAQASAAPKAPATLHSLLARVEDLKHNLLERWRCWRWWWQVLITLEPTETRRWLW